MQRRNFLVAASAGMLGLLATAPSLGSLIPAIFRRKPKTVVWLGHFDSVFTEPRNWLNGQLPFDGCDLLVRGGGAPMYFDSPLTINTLTIDGGAVQFPHSGLATLKTEDSSCKSGV